MKWILLESLVALVILVLIVGWTMRPAKRERSGPGKDAQASERDPER